jgi:F-type H+-transporting ATPase subunit gamma
MASLKAVRGKIAGVKKTKQITKAMNMVASAKLRGAQGRIEHFRPYADKFRELLSELAGKAEAGAHPLLAVRPAPAVCGIILITSDRGLCGGFNSNLAAAAVKLAKARAAEGRGLFFYNIGRKGREAIAKLGYAQADLPRDIMEKLDFQAAAKLGERIMASFLAGEVDEVYMVLA